MIAMQAVCLRAFLLVVRVPMYTLASVILLYCAIGVFALNNVSFDIWTLFIFGVLGYVLKTLGFPLAPMILGVVLGHVAELNLSRALAISEDLSLFVTRPWALFFLLISVFSAAFPWYQARRHEARWTLLYFPSFCLAIVLPLLMMEGMVRPALAGALLLLAAFTLWRHHRAGWQLPLRGSGAEVSRLRET